MKTLYLFCVGFLLSNSLFSQDTLITKNGELIAGRVLEINQDEIRYKKSTNLEGPTYVINKADIVLIEYQNGTRDIFTTNNNNSSSSKTTLSNDPIVDNSFGNDAPTPVVAPNTGYSVFIGGFPFIFNRWNWGCGGFWNGVFWGSGWRNNWYWGRNYGGGFASHHGGHYGPRGGGGGSWGHR